MNLRTIRRALRAAVDPYVPVLAQIVVTRKCNLSCGYCNEYDSVSQPVPTETLLRYIDHLADLGTTIITLTGGETLLHPELDLIVRHVVAHDIACTSISNGFLLTREWIERLNDAGLRLMQISVDNLEPNDTSQKSMTVLRKRLPLLKQFARFDVNINAVLGSCSVTETRQLVREVREMGLFMTVGLLHGSDGMLDRGLLEQDDLEQLYSEMNGERRRSFLHRFGEGWEKTMIHTGQSDWKCRAGARYLYVDEFGKVSYCSQRRGEPGVPLLEFTRAHARYYSRERKGCESGCTISCVRRASSVDRFRWQHESPRSVDRQSPTSDHVAPPNTA